MEEVKKEIEQTAEVKEVITVDENVNATPEENHVIETESSDDEFESQEGLWTGNTKYDVPDNADKFVDTKDGTVVDKEDLTPFQMIKAVAKQNNHNIKDPDKGCRKCYGRGYEGMDSETKMPIPCRCLFRGKTEKEKEADMMYDMKNNPGKLTGLQKRRVAKALFKQFKIQRKIINRQKMNPKSEKTEITEEQKKSYIANILKVYEETMSLKKTAQKVNITLTELKKIVKESRSKVEKLKTKENE